MNLNINALPAPTFNWLHMNEASLEGVCVSGRAVPAVEVPAGIQESFAEKQLLKNVKTGGGNDMDELIEAAGIPMRVFAVPAGVKITDDAVRMTFEYEDQAAEFSVKKDQGEKNNDITGKINSVGVILEKDSELTVVMDYTSEKSAKGLAAVQTKISVGENAKLRLIQIQRTGSGYTFLNDVGVKCADNASFEVIHLVLGGKNTFQGCNVDLGGYKSTFNADIGYMVKGDGHLDMNYNAYHTGKKTECEINASGVLRDEAFKIFRGTIDFQEGCSGSVGSEMEDVLMMDDGVSNQTIPLILCGEEDVSGNHGATIGRLDEKLMFYMQSRGMNTEEIYEMMARARIDAVIRKIPDEKTRLALTDGTGDGDEFRQEE